LQSLTNENYHRVKKLNKDPSMNMITYDRLVNYAQVLNAIKRNFFIEVISGAKIK